MNEAVRHTAGKWITECLFPDTRDALTKNRTHQYCSCYGGVPKMKAEKGQGGTGQIHYADEN